MVNDDHFTEPGGGPQSSDAPAATPAVPTHPVANRELTCVHTTCADRTIGAGTPYHSSRQGPMHVDCSHRTTPVS